MKKLYRLLGGLLLVGVLGGCAASISIGGSGPGTSDKTGLGKIFTDAKGMSLYTYDADTPGKSNCAGLCAVFWPPVMATDTAKAAGGLTVISRDDGTKQWAYRGKPLYGYANDSKAGDTTGDGVDGVWHIAKR